MKKHTKNYLNGMQIQILERFEDMCIMCEWCCRSLAVDIHHISARGAGGSKLKDTVDNLVALCRECHKLAEARKINKEELKRRHLKNISASSLTR